MAADLRFRLHGHQDRQPTYSIQQDGNYVYQNNHELNTKLWDTWKQNTNVIYFYLVPDIKLSVAGYMHSPLDRQIPMWHRILVYRCSTHHIQSWTWFISDLTCCQNRLKDVSSNGWAARCLYVAAEIRQGHTAMFQTQSHSSISQASKEQPSLRSITISFGLKKKFTSVRDYAFCPKSKGHS